MAGTLARLGRLLHTEGDIVAARTLFERALAICEKVLGAAHPKTVRVRNNLAELDASDEA
ncbi:MAG: tetratricopeptide repeat protein [Methylovirgula sp.]